MNTTACTILQPRIHRRGITTPCFRQRVLSVNSTRVSTRSHHRNQWLILGAGRLTRQSLTSRAARIVCTWSHRWERLDVRRYTRSVPRTRPLCTHRPVRRSWADLEPLRVLERLQQRLATVEARRQPTVGDQQRHLLLFCRRREPLRNLPDRAKDQSCSELELSTTHSTVYQMPITVSPTMDSEWNHTENHRLRKGWWTPLARYPAWIPCTNTWKLSLPRQLTRCQIKHPPIIRASIRVRPMKPVATDRPRSAAKLSPAGMATRYSMIDRARRSGTSWKLVLVRALFRSFACTVALSFVFCLLSAAYISQLFDARTIINRRLFLVEHCLLVLYLMIFSVYFSRTPVLSSNDCFLGVRRKR